jgi:hypothetical protein
MNGKKSQYLRTPDQSLLNLSRPRKFPKKHQRSHSNLTFRESFAPVLSYDIDKWEEELRKIETSVLKSNRRSIGSLIGAGICFISVFFASGEDIVYGMLGAFFGLGVGYLIGKKIPGKNIRSSDLERSTQYQLKLTCSLIYLSKLRKEQINISDFSSLLEKIIDDFRPALNYSGKRYSRQIRELSSILRKNTVHIALLNAVIELNNDVESEVLPFITGVRIMRFFIPVLEVLKNANDGWEQELEIVKRIEETLQTEKVKKILAKLSAFDEETIKSLLPYTAFASKQVGKHGVFSRNLAVIENFLRLKKMKNCNEGFLKAKKKFTEKLRFRKLSLSESGIFEKKRKLGFNDDRTLRTLFETYRSQHTFSVGEHEDISFKSFSMTDMNLRRSIFRNPTVAVIKNRHSVLFEGNLLDLHAGIGEEDQEDSILLPIEHKIQKKNSKSRLTNPSLKEKVHKFQECFDFLLAIEKQPKPEVIWKKVIQRHNLQVFVQKNSGSIISIRAYCALKFSLDVVVTALWDPQIRLLWDSFVHRFEVVEKGDMFEILYIAVTTPSALAKRDMVQRRVRVDDYPEKDTVCMHFTSAEHPSCPVFDDYVRAETLVSGYVLRRVQEELTELSILTKTNVKGIIPIEMFAKLASKSPETWINDLKKGCGLVKAREKNEKD